jgi:hypothetical protein
VGNSFRFVRVSRVVVPSPSGKPGCGVFVQINRVVASGLPGLPGCGIG